jgi:hypothetical protein
MFTRAEIAGAIGSLLPGVTAANVNVDAMMLKLNTGNPNSAKPILFSIAPISGVADGGEIFVWDGVTSGGATFLNHGGHLWDTAFDVQAALGTNSENVNALEAVATAAEPRVRLSELYVAPEDPEHDRQFVEISGPAGASLDDVWILEIDGDAAGVGDRRDNPGTIVTAIDLTGHTIGANGLFLWRPVDTPAAPENDLLPARDPQTNVKWQDVYPGAVDLGYEGDEGVGGVHDPPKEFEDDVVSFLLVEGFDPAAAPTGKAAGQRGWDLDTIGGGSEGGDGIFDSTPWTAILDAVAMCEGSGEHSADRGVLYADGQLNGGFVAPTMNADLWIYDADEEMWMFVDSSSGDAAPEYQGPFYANDGSGWFVPGGSEAWYEDGRNIVVAADSEFLFATPGSPNGTGIGGLYFGDVDHDGDVDAADIDTVYDFVNAAESYYSAADIDLDFGVTEGDVDELVREVLGTEYGDVNLDGKVDAGDLNILLSNYDSSGGWAQGDLDGSDTVDASDLDLLLSFYGFVAPAEGVGALGTEDRRFHATPEPSSLVLLVTLLVAAAGWRRRRCRRPASVRLGD